MKHFEFWSPRIFEAPYFLYLAAGALWRRLPFKFVAKANYALDHGELGFGSKLHTQLAFDQQRFLPTALLGGALDDKLAQAKGFGDKHGYPLILKPDQGRVGKGIVQIRDEATLSSVIPTLSGPYLIQKFTANNVEFGVFFVRQDGRSRITGINQKHFPTVVGDGCHNLAELARAHPRYRSVWQAFMNDLDVHRVPSRNESVQLSFIGSHTLGCKFTNDTHKLTAALEASVVAVCASQPGFNFGRLDLKASSEEAFFAGEFVVIEVNGIASLPTHMFDPKHTLRQGYNIFLEHGRYLLDCADEHREQPMSLDTWPTIFGRLRRSGRNLQAAHGQLAGSISRQYAARD